MGLVESGWKAAEKWVFPVCLCLWGSTEPLCSTTETRSDHWRWPNKHPRYGGSKTSTKARSRLLQQRAGKDEREQQVGKCAECFLHDKDIRFYWVQRLFVFVHKSVKSVSAVSLGLAMSLMDLIDTNLLRVEFWLVHSAGVDKRRPKRFIFLFCLWGKVFLPTCQVKSWTCSSSIFFFVVVTCFFPNSHRTNTQEDTGSTVRLV